MIKNIVVAVFVFVLTAFPAFAGESKNEMFQKQCFRNAMKAHGIDQYCSNPISKREMAVCAAATKKAIAVVLGRCSMLGRDDCKDHAMQWLNGLSKKNQASTTMHNVLIDSCNKIKK